MENFIFCAVKSSPKAIVLQNLLFKIIHVTCTESVNIYFTKNAENMYSILSISTRRMIKMLKGNVGDQKSYKIALYTLFACGR